MTLHESLQQAETQLATLQEELAHLRARLADHDIAAAVPDATAVSASLRQAQEMLRQSAQHYRLLFETMLQGVVYQDADGAITAVNQAAERILGMEPTEFLGETSVSVERDTLREDGTPFPGSEHPSMVALRTGQQVKDVVMGVYNPREQGYRWINVTAIPLFRENEATPYQVYTIFDDITERKLAQEALCESEARLHAIIDNTTAVIYVKDLEGRFLLVNRAFEQLFRLSHGAILGKTDEDLYCGHPEITDIVQANDHAVLERGRAFLFEERVLLPDGIHTFISAKFPLRDAAGESYAICGISTDITERKWGEEEREHLLTEVGRRAAELDATLNAIGDGLLIFDQQGQLIRINAAAERIVAFSETERALPLAEQAKLVQMVTPDQQALPHEEQPSLRALQGLETHGRVLAIRHHEQLTWVFVSAAPIRLEDGEIRGAVVSLTDITQLHDLQEQQRIFVHMMSHDLRAPLTIIHGFAELLREELMTRKLNGSLLGYLETIQRSDRRMNVMIQDLVDTARVEGGELVLHRQLVMLSTYLHDYLRRATTFLAVERLHLQLPPDLPPVTADPDHVERILTNLLTNAQKYSTPNTPITVCACRLDGEVEIAVTDQGRGINADDLPHIFERFYRAKSGRQAEGIGLGLYITKMLVEAHGGHIWVESEPGQGSTFTFTLPVT